jgi:hypothetical protein
MTLTDAAVARVHEVFGVFFLIVLAVDTQRRLIGGTTRASRVVAAVFLLAGVGMWAATVFATNAADYLIHSTWANILIVVGAVEWAHGDGRRKGVAASLALPAGIVASGVLFLLHLHGSVMSDPGTRWHAGMGAALVAGGLLEAAGILARRRGPAVVLLRGAPLALFCLLLLTYP